MASNLEDRSLYRVWLRDNYEIFDVLALNFREAIAIVEANVDEKILLEFDIDKAERLSRNTIYRKS